MLSRFWPHTAYAEDIPFSHSRLILTTHVLHRGFQAGAFLGSVVGIARSIPSIIRSAPLAKGTASSIGINSSTTLLSRTKSALPVVVRSIGVGAILGLGAIAVVLPLQMARAESIEWQDRSWRLLRNIGQVEVDDWSAAGMAMAVVVMMAKGSSNRRQTMELEGQGKKSGGLLFRTLGLGWKGAVGGVGMGSLIGVLGYLAWRGVRGNTGARVSMA